MQYALKLHANARCAAVTGIDVIVSRLPRDLLALRYIVHGAIGDLRLPAPAAPVRTNDLWRHTCFEAFVRPRDETRYVEINLAPSAAWALYAFDDYRAGMRDAKISAPPQITLGQHTDDTLELRAAIALASLEAPHAPWRLGLSAVIEDTSGGVSYWAATHAPDKPDFHHADSFSIDLPVPEHP